MGMRSQRSGDQLEKARRELFEACTEGNVRLARKALRSISHAPDVVDVQNSEGLYPLHIAVVGKTPGHAELVKMLCEEFDADETKRDLNMRTPLELAKNYLSSRLEVREYLDIPKHQRPKRRCGPRKKKDVGYAVDANELLFHAVVAMEGIGDERLVRECMANGADVHARNKYGATALHLAAAALGTHGEKNVGIRMVSLLVNDFGADVQLQKNWGDTPLHWAAAEGNVDVCRLLVLDLGAYVDAQNQAGNTALHFAAYEGHQDCCEALICELRASARAENALKKSPLEMAATGTAPSCPKVKAWLETRPEYIDDDEED